MARLNDTIRDAELKLRLMQAEFEERITSEWCVYVGNCWRSALEKDPEGSQLKYVVEEARELLND
ncbi:hypothetical protein KC573_04615 [candidate division WWE3 bacterium]|uniref:Uncharacterized protein n=1 Tax=candidate division WWE3 bacterium TaxID=2053526 RepID=A0A955LX77_UNCKA|nr:hypothetical protein [candidate division WWE3 bacterium]